MPVNQQENRVDICAFDSNDGNTSVDITCLLRGTKHIERSPLEVELEIYSYTAL